MSQFARYPSLVDRTVLVSGGATGIGETLVREFAAQGAKVGFIDIAREAGQALARELAGSRHAPLFVEADLTDIPALERAIAAVRERFGAITLMLGVASLEEAAERARDLSQFDSWRGGGEGHEHADG